mmetsp:Transcript_25180/g.86276  ORF Transcript_25180/g.86276 Transcript_25180/m.86276 type:complete len:239 (-) Transcript_25180:58-774(-)
MARAWWRILRCISRCSRCMVSNFRVTLSTISFCFFADASADRASSWTQPSSSALILSSKAAMACACSATTASKSARAAYSSSVSAVRWSWSLPNFSSCSSTSSPSRSMERRLAVYSVAEDAKSAWWRSFVVAMPRSISARWCTKSWMICPFMAMTRSRSSTLADMVSVVSRSSVSSNRFAARSDLSSSSKAPMRLRAAVRSAPPSSVATGDGSSFAIEAARGPPAPAPSKGARRRRAP